MPKVAPPSGPKMPVYLFLEPQGLSFQWDMEIGWVLKEEILDKSGEGFLHCNTSPTQCGWMFLTSPEGTDVMAVWLTRLSLPGNPSSHIPPGMWPPNSNSEICSPFLSVLSFFKKQGAIS